MKNYVITIARGYGSGGRSIGKILAKKLGISYYDKEIMQLASRETGINRRIFDMADESLRYSSILKISQNVYRGENLEDGDPLSNKELFNYQARVLRELASKESFVIIGRCADYVLRDYPRVIKIFVHASIERCIENVSTMTSLSGEELRNFIIRTDYQRAQYYKFHTGQDWCDARNYDICLRTDTTAMDDCIDIIMKSVEMRIR